MKDENRGGRRPRILPLPLGRGAGVRAIAGGTLHLVAALTLTLSHGERNRVSGDTLYPIP